MNLMTFGIFEVHQNNNACKRNNEEKCKNQLTSRKHA